MSLTKKEIHILKGQAPFCHYVAVTVVSLQGHQKMAAINVLD